MLYDPKILEGVNKLCANCKNNCKQFKGVTVVKCPHFVSIIPKKQKELVEQTQGV